MQQIIKTINMESVVSENPEETGMKIGSKYVPSED
jgi:hypothetical protein